MQTPGCFIVVEGLEGAGKTSAIETISNFLKTHALSVCVTREPGGTRIGERLRALMKEGMAGEVFDARCELLLMYAARVQLVGEVIKPALARGEWVIADRFELSTYAYQGSGRGLDTHIIDSLSTICLNNFKPDYQFFLDISPVEGLNRIQIRGELDRIEQESMAFFNRVYEGYHHYIGKMDNICIIDASAPFDTVQKDILTQLKHFLLIHDHS